MNDLAEIKKVSVTDLHNFLVQDHTSFTVLSVSTKHIESTNRISVTLSKNSASSFYYQSNQKKTSASVVFQKAYGNLVPQTDDCLTDAENCSYFAFFNSKEKKLYTRFKDKVETNFEGTASNQPLLFLTLTFNTTHTNYSAFTTNWNPEDTCWEPISKKNNWLKNWAVNFDSEAESRLNKSLTELKTKYSKQTQLLDTEQLECKRLEEEKEKLTEQIQELEQEKTKEIKQLKEELANKVTSFNESRKNDKKVRQEQEKQIKNLKENLEKSSQETNQTITLYQQKITDLENQLINLAKQKIKGKKEALELVKNWEIRLAEKESIWQSEKKALEQKIQQITEIPDSWKDLNSVDVDRAFADIRQEFTAKEKQLFNIVKKDFNNLGNENGNLQQKNQELTQQLELLQKKETEENTQLEKTVTELTQSMADLNKELDK